MPLRWADDKQLGTWVRAQRASKKKMDRGEPSNGMAAARVLKLEALAFAWELSAAAVSKRRSEGQRDDASWEAQLAKLEAYKWKHGDCSVPQGWAEEPGLGNWVKNQRQHKRNLDQGEPSEAMTAVRVAKLEALGFAWQLVAGWEAQLAKLKAYKRKHGDCNVPQGWAEDPTLAN